MNAINLIRQRIELTQKAINCNNADIREYQERMNDYKRRIDEVTRMNEAQMTTVNLLEDVICDLQHEARANIDMEPFMRLCQDNRKIEAIKTYRSITGASLKEAKDAVEDYYARWSCKPGNFGEFLDQAMASRQG